MKFFSFLGKRQLYLAMLAFIFVATTALAAADKEIIENIPLVKKRNYQVAALPVLANASFFPVISAQGVIAIDTTSAVVLYEKNADLPLLPASTTKIITALVAMDSFSPETIIRVGDVRVEGQKMGLVKGEEITVENLLYGLLVFSANDAAEVLAANYPGGREAFVAAMNVKAQSLSLSRSRFTNPVGLDGLDQVSTARDLVRVGQIAMENSYFSQIVGTREKVVTDRTGQIRHRLTNINELLGKVNGVVGVKTGWTENARENLVTYVVRDDKKVMIALLGSQDRFGETRELIDWIFANYKWTRVTALESTQP